MVTDQDKMVYILTNPALRDWTCEDWVEMWQNYLDWCVETAELNDTTADDIQQGFDFLDWYADWKEDQEYAWAMARTLRD